MEQDQKILQLFYAGALADAVSHFESAGILEEVAQKKKAAQAVAAPGQLKQLGISNPEELFERFSEIFGCIRWKVQKEGEEYIAQGKHCLLCAIAKKMGTAQPCNLYCINPFEALLKAMTPSNSLEVEGTLWEGEGCRFRVKP